MSEVELLLKICLRYRARLPSYLRASQPELALIDEIVAKLKNSG